MAKRAFLAVALLAAGGCALLDDSSDRHRSYSRHEELVCDESRGALYSHRKGKISDDDFIEEARHHADHSSDHRYWRRLEDDYAQGRISKGDYIEKARFKMKRECDKD